MLKVKDVTVVDSWVDFMANVTDEMLQNENIIKIHVKGSDEILFMYIFEGEYCVDVVDVDTYLNTNCLSFTDFDELLEEVEVAYGELL